MVSLAVPPVAIDSLRDNALEGQPHVLSAHYFTRTLELYEVSNHIMFSQPPACSSFGEGLGLPRLYQNEEYFGTVLQLDACLNKWEKSLPQSLRVDISQGGGDDVSHRQGVILRLRLLDARILLFRPMLARFCLSQSQAASTGSALDKGLGGHLFQYGASICVNSAQKMVSLVHEHHKPDGTIGILPWWHRIFYLHVAGTILIAAMLRTDLFTPIVSESWSRAMSALRAHEHLSPFVQQCVTTFQTLSRRILDTHHPTGGEQFPPPEGSSNTYFQDVVQDMGFDPDMFLFDKEDMTWPSNFEST